VLESGPGFDLHVINGRKVANILALVFFIPAEISHKSTTIIDSTNDSTNDNKNALKRVRRLNVIRGVTEQETIFATTNMLKLIFTNS